MADFKTAVLITLKNEGGYVDNPLDPGGATNMGVEQRDLPDIDIKSLTQDQAIAFYQERYWKPLYSQIEDQGVANKLFDMGVLFGIGTAVMNIQTALDIMADGIFGPETLQSTNGADPASLLSAFKTLLVTRALYIGQTKPSERVFVAGWIRRINS
jgi:lysozyme family protein